MTLSELFRESEKHQCLFDYVIVKLESMNKTKPLDSYQIDSWITGDGYSMDLKPFVEKFLKIKCIQANFEDTFDNCILLYWSNYLNQRELRRVWIIDGKTYKYKEVQEVSYENN